MLGREWEREVTAQGRGEGGDGASEAEGGTRGVGVGSEEELEEGGAGEGARKRGIGVGGVRVCFWLFLVGSGRAAGWWPAVAGFRATQFGCLPLFFFF